MDTVTIIMSTYQGETYIAEQIDSIMDSDYEDFILMFTDDGSKDGTLTIIQKYKAMYPDKIQIHCNEVNLGCTLNFLTAACRTESDYIMFCDQDDIWKSDKISNTLKKLKEMEKNHGKDSPIAVFTDAEVVDANLNRIHESFFKSGKLNPNHTDLPHLLMENKLIGCTMMFNKSLRDILKSKPLPQHARFHDWWIGLIAASCGHIECLHEPTLLYRQHGKNVVGNQEFWNYVKKRFVLLGNQKKTLLSLQEQAAEILTLYCITIPEKNCKLIQVFSQLESVNPIIRRAYMLRYGFLKSGFIRNIGLMIIA